jgi:hypothetical protein
VPCEDDVELEDLAALYSAVYPAAAGPAAADDVSVGALARARLARRSGAPIGRRRLVADAVRRAVAVAPCAPLRELPGEQREAIALARMAGLDVEEIAAAVGAAPAVVRARLRDGLRAIALRPRHAVSG